MIAARLLEKLTAALVSAAPRSRAVLAASQSIPSRGTDHVTHNFGSSAFGATASTALGQFREIGVGGGVAGASSVMVRRRLAASALPSPVTVSPRR